MKFVRNIVLIIFCFASSFEIKAQPYIYYSIQLSDTLYGEFEKLVRYNLAANSVEDFLPEQAGKYVSNVWDPSQSYIAIDIHNWTHTLFNCSNTAISFDLTERRLSIDEILFSPYKNKLYLFTDKYENIFVFNLSSGDITNELSLGKSGSYFYNDLMYPERSACFSSNGNKIYFYKTDSTDADQVWTYSLETNSIIEKRNLADIGYAGVDGHGLVFCRNGKGIIESGPVYTHPVKDFYFRLYDFNTDSAYSFIYYNGFGQACFTGNGEFLLIMEENGDLGDSITPYCTGLIRIYSTWSGQLLKTLNLPVDGIVYTFDNYPNDIYYVKDLKLPTRQIFTLKMDSIFNELDLSSLTPSTTNVNSFPFTLTVKGKGFDTLSTVYFNGQPKTTTFISDSILTSEILTSDVVTTGTFPVWVKDRYSISDTLQFIVSQNTNPNLIVRLKNSLGNQIPASNVQYYEGSWKDAVSNGDGTFTVITNQNNVSLRMTYEYGQQTVNNIPAHNNTYTFQTVSANVQLKNSLGALIDTGSVQYYAGAWRSFGTTTNGVATKELLPINYSFRMTYAYASIDKQQNLSSDPTVVFQTVNAQVQLKNSLGNLIDQGTVQYYAGAWRSFGTTTNGVATKELLPINYSFRMTYAYASIDKQQNLSSDPIVVFQTVNSAVQLKNSLGNLIDQGTVQYYAGAWRSFGTTTNGVATKELLPINYSFKMTYEFASIDKQQDISTNPTVVFQTVNAAVQLNNSLGNLIDVGTVQYYAGAWRNFGTTTNGVATKELLPINYSFRMTHEFLSKDKQQNLSTNPVVDFQTVLCTVKVTNSTNQPIENASVKYYAGAWRDLGTTNSEGITTKELLPQNISFRASYGSTSLDKQQDINANALVVFMLNVP
jgi:hypothetical protein